MKCNHKNKLAKGLCSKCYYYANHEAIKANKRRWWDKHKKSNL